MLRVEGWCLSTLSAFSQPRGRPLPLPSHAIFTSRPRTCARHCQGESRPRAQRWHGESRPRALRARRKDCVGRPLPSFPCNHLYTPQDVCTALLGVYGGFQGFQRLEPRARATRALSRKKPDRRIAGTCREERGHVPAFTRALSRTKRWEEGRQPA